MIGVSLAADAYNLNQHGLDTIFSMQSEPVAIEEVIQSVRTQSNIEKTVEQVVRVLKINIRNIKK